MTAAVDPQLRQLILLKLFNPSNTTLKRITTPSPPSGPQKSVMTDGDLILTPPDPPGTENPTAYKPKTKVRGDSRASRPSINTPSTPLPPAPTPSQYRMAVSGLAEFEAGKARKRQATSGPDDNSRRIDPTYLGTPRSVRFKNLFADSIGTPSLLAVTRKLYGLIEDSLKLPKKGAEKVTVGSESAADIKTLAARLLEIAELQAEIPAVRRNPFLSEEEDHQVERALAGANAFGCKVPDVIEAQLANIAKELAEIKHAATLPSKDFSFTSRTRQPPTPSYALAASKHAPPTTASALVPRLFRPVMHKTPPPPPPTSLKPNNTVTLVQRDKEGTVLSAVNYPTLITLINSKLTEANVKEKPTDVKPIQVRSVHRHPSNDLVIYTTTSQQADELRKQGDKWIHLLSRDLKLQHPVHTVVVHGIPASFQPTDPQNLEMLIAMNPETMTPPPTFVKWVSINAIQRGASHSSICIGFTDADQAKRAVDQKIFFGRYNKRTEYGRRIKPRCMNCLQDGHTSSHCKADIMCPYCAGTHAADKCEHKGKLMSNCTACARAIKKATPDTDLEALF